MIRRKWVPRRHLPPQWRSLPGSRVLCQVVEDEFGSSEPVQLVPIDLPHTEPLWFLNGEVQDEDAPTAAPGPVEVRRGRQAERQEAALAAKPIVYPPDVRGEGNDAHIGAIRIAFFGGLMLGALIAGAIARFA